MTHATADGPYDSWVSQLPQRPDLLGLPPPPSRIPLAQPPARPPRVRLTAVIVLLTLLAIVGAAVAPALPRIVRSSSSADAAYSFILPFGQDGPVRWNPCDAIHYVVNLGSAPEGSLGDVQEAVRRDSAATGIAFAYDGPTDEVPMEGRSPYQPERYGDRWAPVVIAWVAPGQTDIPFQKDGHTAAGVAAPQLADGRERVYVSGWVILNAQDPNEPGFSYYGDQGLVVQHELSHVMGLGHVKEWGELMEGSGGGVTDFGPGDMEGLRLLGRSQGCLSTPDPG